MSITGALNAAMSGLTATARRAETVSSNVANAATPGYGRREVQLSSGLAGGLVAGVSVRGVGRSEDLILLGQRRESQAGLNHAETGAAFLAELEEAIGLPGTAGSLSARLSAFGTALNEAASRPDSGARLQRAVDGAADVAGHLNMLSDRVQDARLRADQEISRSVDLLNSALKQVSGLNAKIVQYDSSNRDLSGLQDKRQRVIDDIAGLVPIRQIARENGAVALFTSGGGSLVDGKAATFGFSGAGAMDAQTTFAGGGLSGLTINGQPVDPHAANGLVAGGRLAALFEVRDETAPNLQAGLDTVARDLLERMQGTAVDPTLAPGDPGLFTDGGAALNPLNEVGLSGRIAVNAAVDPGAGGAAWRLRAGLNAPAPGAAGDATLLAALGTALEAPRQAASGDTTLRSAAGHAGALLSHVSTAALDADAKVSFAAAQTDALRMAEYQDGVDTDHEMQELMLVEQAYAANARVIATVDTLIQTLLEI